MDSEEVVLQDKEGNRTYKQCNLVDVNMVSTPHANCWRWHASWEVDSSVV